MPPTQHVVYLLTKLELGGAQKVCLTLLEGLQKTPGSASLISGAEGVLVEQATKHDSVFLLKSFKREVSIFAVFTEFKTLITLVKLLRQLRHKHHNLIVHTHSTKAGIIGRWAAWLAGVRTIIHTVHGFGFHEHQRKMAWWLIFCAEYFTQFITSHFVFVSTNDLKTGNKLLAHTKNRSSLIRAAVAWDAFYHPARRTTLPEQEPFIIGSVACFKPQKNCLDLLRAAAHVINHTTSDRKVILEIVGDGMQRPELEAWIAEHNLQGSIKLVGWQQDVAAWMSRWHVFALSSLWEGLPCSIIEARLQKLPVVAYNVGGIAEVITNDVNGYLITPRDWPDLANKLLMLTNNSETWSRLAHYQDFLDDYKDSTMIAHHQTLYANLSSSQKR